MRKVVVQKLSFLSVCIVAVELPAFRVGIDVSFLFKHFTAFQKVLLEVGLRFLKNCSSTDAA